MVCEGIIEHARIQLAMPRTPVRSFEAFDLHKQVNYPVHGTTRGDFVKKTQQVSEEFGCVESDQECLVLVQEIAMSIA